MLVGGKSFKNYTFVMAIINLTPDSFYACSRTGKDGALFAAERAVKEGAAILDLGAQSTRPGYEEIGEDEELFRLIEPLSAVKREFGVPISADTYSPRVAQLALAAGADMINDVKGLSVGNMAGVIAQAEASACIMHDSGKPMRGDIWGQIIKGLSDGAKKAVDAGISRDKICLDGGIGFSKTKEQSLELLNGYGRLAEVGYPLLLGASRKSLFGGRVEDRLAATVESTRLAVRQGVLFVRVHDVKENALAIKEEYERNKR